MKNNVSTMRKLSVVLLVLILFSGCVTSRKRHYEAAPVYYEHTVKYSGETLALISRWYTGKSSNWEAIVAENVGLKPERIRIGDRIRIPEALLVRDKPLPKSALPVAKLAVPEPSEEVVTLEEELEDLEQKGQEESFEDDEASKELLAELEALDQEVDDKVEEPASIEPEVEERDELLDELLAE